MELLTFSCSRGSDAARRTMAVVARGCLIKLYELTNLSSYKGENPHQCIPEHLPLQQDSPGEDSPEGVHVRLHPDKSLTDGDEVGDVRHPLVRHLLRRNQPLLGEGGQHHLIYVGGPPTRHCAPESRTGL